MGSALRLRAPIASELTEQIAVIDFWRWWAPTMGLDRRLLISIPNGSYLAGDAAQRARQAAKLKATGMRPGVPDLILALPTKLWPALWIEMKRVGGRPSDEQLEMCGLLRLVGYNVVIAQGADEAIKALKAYVAAK